jgi:hypothetical protein
MIEKITITAILVIFIYASMEKKMIFSFIRKLLDSLPEYIQKPIFDCYICMCPWWGGLLYWLIWHNSWHECLITIAGAGGFNTIVFLLSVRQFE